MKQLNFLKSDMQVWQEDYDSQNPHLWDYFLKYTLKIIALGYKRSSARHVIHIIRYETALAAKDDIFKCSDHITPYYARKFMAMYPQHDGFFTIKRKA